MLSPQWREMGHSFYVWAVFVMDLRAYCFQWLPRADDETGERHKPKRGLRQSFNGDDIICDFLTVYVEANGVPRVTTDLCDTFSGMDGGGRTALATPNKGHNAHHRPR